MPTVAELKQQVDRIWFQSLHTDLATAHTQQLRQHALAGVRAALEEEPCFPCCLEYSTVIPNTVS